MKCVFYWWNTWSSIWRIWIVFIHLKLWIASARHSFQWVKILIMHTLGDHMVKLVFAVQVSHDLSAYDLHTITVLFTELLKSCVSFETCLTPYRHTFTCFTWLRCNWVPDRTEMYIYGCSITRAKTRISSPQGSLNNMWCLNNDRGVDVDQSAWSVLCVLCVVVCAVNPWSTDVDSSRQSFY